MAVTITGNSIQFPTTFSNDTYAQGLDDYEEGTFTPTTDSSTGAFSSISKAGLYRKQGNTVTVELSILITTLGGASGYLYVGGLPFTKRQDGAGIVGDASGFFREIASVGYMGVYNPVEDDVYGITTLYNNGATAVAGYHYIITVLYRTNQ